MWCRYNSKVTDFFNRAESCAGRVYDEKYDSENSCYVVTEYVDRATYTQPLLTARENWHDFVMGIKDKVGIVRIPLDVFTVKKSGDYRVYNSFLNAYHAIARYYTYKAKYNLKDDELEAALKDWNKAVNPKTNIWSKIFQIQK